MARPNRMPPLTVRGMACAFIGLLVGCSSGSDPSVVAPADGSAPAAPTEFVAQASTFAGFCKWSSAPATPIQSVPVGIHGLNDMVVYWRQPPPHGATSFPVGTVILKESQDATPASRIVFAMVKRKARGAGYNSDGADGWEWFSLQDLGSCSASINWRGPSAPVLTSYSDLLVGDCNGCHGKVTSSDYVWDTALQLSSF
jgi:hypothetical protein